MRIGSLFALSGTALTFACGLVAAACGSDGSDGGSDGDAATNGDATVLDSGADGAGATPPADGAAPTDGATSPIEGGLCASWGAPVLLQDPPAVEPVPGTAYAVVPEPELMSVAVDGAGTSIAIWSLTRAGTYCGNTWYGNVYASRRPLGGTWSPATVISGVGSTDGGNSGALLTDSQISLNPDGNGFIISGLTTYCDTTTVGNRFGLAVARVTPTQIQAPAQLIHNAGCPSCIGPATTDTNGVALTVLGTSPTIRMGQDGSALLVFGASNGGPLGANFAMRFDPTKNAWDAKATALAPLVGPDANAALNVSTVVAGPGGSFLVAWLSGLGKTFANWYTPGTGWGTVSELGVGTQCTNCPLESGGGYRGAPIDAIVDAQGNAFVAWRQTQAPNIATDPIVVAHFTKGGGWEAPLTIPRPLPPGNKAHALRLVATPSGGAMLSWLEVDPASGPPTSYHFQSTEFAGGTWSSPTLVATIADVPCMATDETGRQLMMTLERTQAGQILTTRSFVPGQGWGTPMPVVNPLVTKPGFERMPMFGTSDLKPGECAAFNRSGQSAIAWKQLIPPATPGGDTKHQIWAATCP